MKYTSIIYKPTGNKFTLPDDEVVRILQEDRGNNYEVVGKLKKEIEAAVKEEAPAATPTTFDQVVVEDKEAPAADTPIVDDAEADNPVVDDKKAATGEYTKEALELKKVVELKEILNQKKIPFARTDTKDILIDKIIAGV